MIEKLSHIKNPLSVIAIFAGLAELSGTVVLPLLEKDVQHLYVWFLMGFPCLLVVLFFVTLWSNYVVLYAPSDFSNDQIFADLLVNSSPTAKYKKLQGEIRSDGMDTSKATQLAPIENHQAGIIVPSEQQVESDQHSDTSLNTHKNSASHTYSEEIQLLSKTNTPPPSKTFETALVAEELAFNRLSQLTGENFHRNVSMRDVPGVVYDGVSFTQDGAILVEVKFTRTGLFARDNIQHSFLRAKQFWDHLPKNLRKKFEFKFVIVHAKDASTEKLIRMQSAVNAISGNFLFKTEIISYEYEALKLDAQSAVEV
ncbi:hypothetical protein ACIPI6_05985 [Pseudomonas protegens]|uniref:hypothetical protein n=1 Tax=Pseudomonas protegens TaxID=380021 RepID=UPI003819AAF5